MLRSIVFILAALPLLAGDDPWAKVVALKRGAELRVYKTGAKQPIIAKLDEATDENLIIVLKNEQTAIPKDQIDRVDARPAQTGSRITRETKTTVADRSAAQTSPAPGRDTGPSTSVSSGVSVGPTQDFETVYRRRVGVPQK